MKNFIKQAWYVLAGTGLILTSSAFRVPGPAKISKNKSLSSKSAKTGSLRRADFNFKNIQFDFNKASIKKSYYSELDMVASKLKSTKASLKVSGHADNRGSYLVNWKLSQARAESVKQYIAGKGCDTSKIAATEFGDTKPIASNRTREGRQKNRRVEIEAY
ncbi:OmpA family protein [Mucilaginibacter corticis]|uniref:OmpA family protein n=1 Tax=Mucilaginibacter corticis TaxID=2597670 RepID=A0A556MM46_9SPHI|nr:OmpA family protein [Mucilaginibacter corticis]TSJ40980.1 OmpA family protein [Mucilaginibacter corticis]